VLTNRRARLDLAANAIAFMAVGGLLVAPTVRSARNADVVTALACGGMAILMVGSLYHVWQLYVGPRFETSWTSDGTILKSPRVANIVYLWTYLFGALGAGLYLVCYPIGLVDYNLGGVMRNLLLAMSVFLVLHCVSGLLCFRRIRAESYLRVGLDGVETCSAQFADYKHSDWANITDILDQPPNRRRPIRRGLIVFQCTRGGKSVGSTFYADALTSDYDALREWVRFYWQHPEARAELTDGRALERLRQLTANP